MHQGFRTRPQRPRGGRLRLGRAIGRRRFALSVMLAACANATGAWAQDESGGDTLPAIAVTDRQGDDGNGSERGYVAAEASVGNRGRASLMKTPQSVSVITREQIDEQQAATTSQALRYTAGINSERFGGFGSQLDLTRIRGIDADYYLDGLRVIGNPGSWLPQIDAYALERIEVLRGPSSAMYGQGTGGGIVNQVSRRPRDTAEREVAVQYGDVDRAHLGFDATGPLNAARTVLYRFTASGLDSHEQVEGMRHRRLYLAPALTWRISPSTSWTWLAVHSREPSIPDYNSLPAVMLGLNGSPYPQLDRSRNYTDPNFRQSTRTQDALTSIFEHDFGQGWRFTSSARYMYVSSDLQRGVVYGYQLVNGQPWLKGYDELTPAKSSSFTMDNHVTGELGLGPTRHALLAGSDYTTGVLDSAVYSVGPVRFDPYGANYQPVIVPDFSASRAAPWKSHQTFTRVGVYAQDQIAYRRWLLTLSARHDWSRSDDATQSYSPVARETRQRDGKWSGRAGLSYQFDAGLMAYASYATSFDPLVGSDYKGDAFVPVEARQAELGVKFHPAGSRVLLSAALFDLQQTNVKTADSNHLGFNNQTGKIRTRGFDLSATMELLPRLNLIASYTYLSSRVVADPLYADKWPAQTPRHSASAWLDYRLRGVLAGLRLGGGVRYLGATWGDPGNTFRVPSVTLFDLAASYDVGRFLGPTQDATLALNISNLTNRTYVASCTSAMYCFIGQDRVATVTFTYRW